MTTPEKPLKLQPSKIVFSNNYAVDQKTFVRVVNDLNKSVAYRIQSGRPAYYRMVNEEGILEPSQTKDVEIVFKKGFVWDPKEVPLHTFVALTMHPFDEDVQKKSPVAEIFNSGTKEQRKRDIPLTLHPSAGQSF